MSKLWLIISREYMTMVGKKSFIIMTLLIPVLIVIIGLVPVGIAYLNTSGSDTETIAVIDNSGRLGDALKDNDMYHFVRLSGVECDDPHQFYLNSDGHVEAVVIIPADIDSVGSVSVYSDNTLNTSLKHYINRQLSDTLTARRIAAYGVDGLTDMVERAQVDVDVRGVRWSDDGSEQETNTEVAFAIGMILALVTYMFVLSYGAMIMNGVIEEKTNRIVEVIVSSCKPFQLMMGKIIGVGLVGLTQFAIWIVMLFAITMVAGVAIAPSVDPAALQTMQGGAMAPAAAADPSAMQDLLGGISSINFGTIIAAFVFYFIGGYLLYASLFAAFGSAVDQASDASQFTTPIVLIMVIALYAGMACIDNPNGPMAFWCSMIPFTSPIVMMIRLPYDVPAWEVLLSIGILFATAIVITWLAARIYRTGILLYGKKHSIKDIFNWLR